MNQFVLDCSVTMAWCFEDEANAYADSVLDRLAAEQAVVPPIYPLEVANMLVVGERRERLTEADSTRFLALLCDLPIIVDSATSLDTMNRVLSLAREYGISSYDAAYLELAMRGGVSFATLDDKLRKAAEQLGIAVLEGQSAGQ